MTDRLDLDQLIAEAREDCALFLTGWTPNRQQFVRRYESVIAALERARASTLEVVLRALDSCACGSCGEVIYEDDTASPTQRLLDQGGTP